MTTKPIRSRIIAQWVPAVLLTSAALPCLAQESTEDVNVLEEIIVTAQKREEPLQKVPVSITAIPREEILRSAIVTMDDYADLTPALNVEQLDSELDVNVTIRGIADLGGTQHTFGLYLDGFELTAGSEDAVAADLADVERIEVLRGPQGTTFGRNVIAGAISLTSIKPDPTGLAGSVEGEISSYDGRRVRGSMNLPLATDTAALRLTADYRANDGNIDNLGPAGDRNDFERSGARVALRLTPGDRFVADLAGAWQKFDQGRYNTVFDGDLIGTIVSLQELIDAGLGGLPPGSLPAGPPPFPAQNDQVATNTRSFLDATGHLATARLQYDFDRMSLVSISGYAKTERDQQFDIDDSFYDLFISSGESESKFWSSELRLQSTGGGPLSWVVGGLISRAEAEADNLVETGAEATLVTATPGGPLVPDNIPFIGGHFSSFSDNEAIFGEIGYRFAERFVWNVGARYNFDETGETRTDAFNLAVGLPALPDETRVASFEEPTWRTTLRYEATDDLDVYGSVSKGYRAGGVQLDSLLRPSFGPEQAYNYELGAKAILLDRRLMVNAALFHTDWDDVQIQTFDFTTGESSTDNVGKVRIQGVDLDLQATPVDGLKLIVGLSYLDNEILDYINAAGDSFAGSPLPNTPEFSASLIADYEWPLFGRTLGFVRGTYIYVDERLESVDDADLRQFLPSYDRVDLRTGLRGNNWTIEVFAENLLDEKYIAGLTTSGFSLAGSAITSPPQVYGLRLLRDF